MVWHADIENEYAVDGHSFKRYRVSFEGYGSSDPSEAGLPRVTSSRSHTGQFGFFC